MWSHTCCTCNPRLVLCLQAVRTVDIEKAIGKPHTLWCAFAKFYEKHGDIANARVVYEKAIQVRGLLRLCGASLGWRLPVCDSEVAGASAALGCCQGGAQRGSGQPAVDDSSWLGFRALAYTFAIARAAFGKVVTTAGGTWVSVTIK